MAKFNPHKIEAFRDFLDAQTILKNAQKSYEDAARVEQVTDDIMVMGIKVGAVATQHYIRKRDRKRLFAGLVIAGGVYLYKKMKEKENKPYAK